MKTIGHTLSRALGCSLVVLSLMGPQDASAKLTQYRTAWLRTNLSPTPTHRLFKHFVKSLDKALAAPKAAAQLDSFFKQVTLTKNFVYRDNVTGSISYTGTIGGQKLEMKIGRDGTLSFQDLKTQTTYSSIPMIQTQTKTHQTTTKKQTRRPQRESPVHHRNLTLATTGSTLNQLGRAMDQEIANGGNGHGRNYVQAVEIHQKNVNSHDIQRHVINGPQKLGSLLRTLRGGFGSRFISTFIDPQNPKVDWSGLKSALRDLDNASFYSKQLSRQFKIRKIGTVTGEQAQKLNLGKGDIEALITKIDAP
ncbi:MAG: hypothetical protein JRH20_20775 [Deltaproteobacteria bacterium]|nr:hypothetical protein [Deltaproteobacteria bacterium]